MTLCSVIITRHDAETSDMSQKRLVGEADLAGAHSRFRPLEGVKVHYTVEAPPQRSANGKNPDRPRGGVAAAHCYHGFGANTFSWSFVQVRVCGWSFVQVRICDCGSARHGSTGSVAEL